MGVVRLVRLLVVVVAVVAAVVAVLPALLVEGGLVLEGLATGCLVLLVMAMS